MLLCTHKMVLNASRSDTERYREDMPQQGCPHAAAFKGPNRSWHGAEPNHTLPWSRWTSIPGRSSTFFFFNSEKNALYLYVKHGHARYGKTHCVGQSRIAVHLWRVCLPSTVRRRTSSRGTGTASADTSGVIPHLLGNKTAAIGRWENFLYKLSWGAAHPNVLPHRQTPCLISFHKTHFHVS